MLRVVNWSWNKTGTILSRRENPISRYWVVGEFSLIPESCAAFLSKNIELVASPEPGAEQKSRAAEPEDQRADPDQPDPRERRYGPQGDRHLEECHADCETVMPMEQEICLGRLCVALVFFLARHLLDLPLFLAVPLHGRVKVRGRLLPNCKPRRTGGLLHRGLNPFRLVVRPLVSRFRLEASGLGLQH